jgi:PAS domain-containing protein
MKLAELQQAVRAADPAAILVSPHVLNRLIQEVCKLPTLVWEVPHRRCYVVDRHVLFRHVEQDDLDLEPDRLLPPTVILLAQPPVEQLNSLSRDVILLQYWRWLFHANLHLALEKKCGEGQLTPADIHDRVEQIGRTEFEEIRLVLGQDQYLLPPADEPTVYVEFAAVFLELRYFAANLLPIYFPAILDIERVAQLLLRDVDAEDLFTRTRLAGAPAPVVRTDTRSDESHDYYWRLVRNAERDGRAGNNVRAAIVRTKAARVAPAALTMSTRVGAEAELQRLMARLQAALELSDADVAEWLKDLPALLDKADQGSQPVEAALLYDLQQVCLDHERSIYTLDVVEWFLSGGKRPIKRPLPSQLLVRIIKHLRSAAQRLTGARLSDQDRQHLARLLQAALRQSEERLRVRFRPILTDAMLDVGLQPANPAERTAFQKMIEELLDRITEFGFVTFSDLRDVISRNQLKMPDPADPQEFVRGDPLLRLDRRLGTLLDGVYRPGEFYLRWLERFTTLSFGTVTGRWLTRFIALPFGGAFFLTWALHGGLQYFLGEGLSLVAQGLAFLASGLVLLAVMYWKPFQRVLVQVGKWLGRALRLVFLDMPALIWRNPTLRQLVDSWPFQLFYSYLFKPLLVCAFLWWRLPENTFTPLGAITTFLAANFVINSRPGQAVGDLLVQTVVTFYELLKNGLLPGLLRLVVNLFRQIVDTMNYILFTVDEWLRFRGGDSKLAMMAQTILGVLWFPVSFLARFYMVVLIEPGFNPLKAPVSYLAAKITWPIALIVAPQMIAHLTPWLGTVLAWLIVWPIAWLIPDAFGFLFWEMKENWRLYRANRRSLLRPVSVGPRGETVRQLLHPGFHSGTIPKLYAQLREAEREASTTGNWRAARVCRHALEEVQRTIQQLVARELLLLLQPSSLWPNQPLSVGQVTLSCNRIRIELKHAEFPEQPVWLAWEDHAGWLVAGIRQSGWLNHLNPAQRQTLTTALAGLYKLAGIDLVREQVEAHLPATVTCYDITERTLILWLTQRNGKAILYDLEDLKGQLRPRTPDGAYALDWPVLDARQLIFAQVSISWQQWVETWQPNQNANLPTTLAEAGVKLLPAIQE